MEQLFAVTHILGLISRLEASDNGGRAPDRSGFSGGGGGGETHSSISAH